MSPWTWRAVAVAATLLGGAARVPSQEPQRQGPPQIVVTGEGEVRVAPDRATVTVGVQTRAATAAAASTENSRRQRRVIEAVKALGVPAEQISTSGFTVVPETQYDRAGQAAPRTQSYLVSNVVTIELTKVDLVGAVVDGSLAAGANDIRGLAFHVANADSARRAALSTAVARAKADAEAVARAAGESLGPLIELVAGDVEMPGPRPVGFAGRASLAAERVPIEAGQEVVRASVTVRWQFVATPR